MTGTQLRQTRTRIDLSVLVVVGAGVVAVGAAGLTVIGSDSLWLSALGDVIRHTRAVPSGVPYAAAPSTDWVNTTVLGQLLFSAFYAPGSVGVVAAQIVATVVTFVILAWTATRHGANHVKVAVVVVAVALAGATAFLIARAQLLSLVPYIVLLALIRRQQVRPSMSIWWAVPLIALWSNLHGAVLVGEAVLGCYLLFSRLRVQPWTAIGVGAASLVALCLNPGLWRAPQYYLGVFGGEATSDEAGMWARVSFANPFDVMLMIVALSLAVAAFRRRPPVWEYAAAAGLAAAVAIAARNGVWLLLFLAVPAAGPVTELSDPTGPLGPKGNRRVALAAVAAVVAVGAGVVLGLRWGTFDRADQEAARIAQVTRGEVILAPEPVVESLAAAGATVWVSNPLDAFSSADQAAYLAFMKGDATGGRPALDAADVVVAEPGSPPAVAATSSGYRRVDAIGAYALYRR